MFLPTVRIHAQIINNFMFLFATFVLSFFLHNAFIVIKNTSLAGIQLNNEVVILFM